MNVPNFLPETIHRWQALWQSPALSIAGSLASDLERGLQALCALAVLARRREPAVTLAWLLGILLFPLSGMLIYWFVGRDRVRRSARPRLRLLAERRADESAAGIDSVPASVRALARTGWQVGRAPVTGGNRVDVLIDGKNTYESMLSAIDAARHSVDATYYSFARDRTGVLFRDALVAAARRGVRVRVLIDSLGSYRAGSFFGPLSAAGGAWRYFLPLSLWDVTVNLRNHRKILVVDGTIGFTGGLNIGDENVHGTDGHGAWRDTDLRIEGPAATQLQLVFADDWAFTTGGPPEPKAPSPTAPLPGTCPVQIVPSGPDDRAEAIFDVFFAAIAMARSSLDLCTPYFVPDQAIWVAIRSAALRGVRVRILLPMHSDQPLTAAASRSYAEELMQAGVQFYRYLPGMIHAKTLIIDGEWASVGTANMDVRSFRLNFEVTALLYSQESIVPLQAAFERDLTAASLVDEKRFNARPFLERATEGFARLLSPLL